ncbi:MAG: DUF1289 domain-containing protein [Gammaproteobacteria bacterium]|nr:DUF1289 domain-containing protein [Gammaproteobacteria bacterium]MCP5425494.1 DUF1289 domain-containing protein [Gammaproteobacteria bacterium]MCP5459386.1 DUF1289 domain-containing protein [Gammaproteobacteria bacterium]
MTAVSSQPPSPCIDVCELDQRTGLCAGCFRTLDEIAGWSGFSVEEKQRVLDQLEVRCERILDGVEPIA